MALLIRAIYEDGHLRLLDPVDMPQGQQVKITIETLTEEEGLRAALGDLVIWPSTDDDSDAWVEAEAGEISKAFSGSRPLSEMVIEERNSGW